MKSTKTTLIIAIFTSQMGICQINTPSMSIQGNSGTSTNVGIGTSNGVNPNAKLEIQNSGNQLRLSNSSTIYSDINTTSAGHLVFTPGTTTGKIGFGPSTPTSLNGFHSNMGRFLISDPASATTRGIIFQPQQTAGGEIPAGSSMSSAITTANEGFAIVPCAYGYAGVKLGAYALAGNGFGGGSWKSMWETTNTSIGNPNLLLVKTAGNVGIGTGASAPRAKLDVNGRVIIGTTAQTGTHSDAMLTVDGKIVAKEIVVTTSNWADYVFAKDYKLPNLYEIEKYYLANKHLPEIPSEKEVIQNGIDLAEMNVLLLKKVEELTILMVEQNKRIKELELKIKL